MTQDEVIKLAKKAGFGNYAYEAAGIFERFAAMVAAAEREKCTGTQEFVTLPREVVDQVRGALAYVGVGNASENPNLAQSTCRQAIWKLDHALRAALEHQQNHVPDAGNMVPAGWRLVPVEPTEKMVDLGRGLSSFPNGVYRAMLSAAPQPPTTEDFSVVQPQANQPVMTPIAQRKLDSLLTEGYTISGYSIYHEQKHQHGFVTGAGLVGWWKPEGVEHVQPLGEQKLFAWISPRALEWGTRQSEKVVKLACKAQPEYDFTEPLYTHPQPKQEPLTDEEIDKLCPQFDDPMRREMWIIGFKAAHNIK